MKTFMCKSPFQAYNTELHKHTTIHTGACFVSISDGEPNTDGMLLLHGITADDDKKMWIQQKVLEEYFKETVTAPEFLNTVNPPIPSRQTTYEALYV